MHDEEQKEQVFVSADEWECEHCTFLNAINWSSMQPQKCKMCGKKNEQVTNLVQEKLRENRQKK